MFFCFLKYIQHGKDYITLLNGKVMSLWPVPGNLITSANRYVINYAAFVVKLRVIKHILKKLELKA